MNFCVSVWILALIGTFSLQFHSRTPRLVSLSQPAPLGLCISFPMFGRFRIPRVVKSGRLRVPPLILPAQDRLGFHHSFLIPPPLPPTRHSRMLRLVARAACCSRTASRFPCPAALGRRITFAPITDRSRIPRLDSDIWLLQSSAYPVKSDGSRVQPLISPSPVVLGF